MLHRRDAMLSLGRAVVGGLTLPGLLRADEARAEQQRAAVALGNGGTAKSCILVYLWGGPPQQDMFDMKPDAPEGIRSHFQPIDTVTPGISLSDQLPNMARHTDKMCLIRSFTHPSNQHEVGVYHTLTGKIDNTLAVPRNQRTRRDFPNMGSVITRFSPRGPLPASVTIPRPIGHDGVTYKGTHAGFLGAQYDPVELKAPGEVKNPPPHSLELPVDLNAARIQSRFGLLNVIEQQQRRLDLQKVSPPYDRFRDQALSLLTSPRAKAAFDLEREPTSLRDRYGRNEYGESFLLARRLVEAGVRLVTVTWYYICPDGNVANVWDNHGGSGSLGGITGYAMLKEKYCLPPLDAAYATLLDDLSSRGLLDDTLVLMLGEFGRTPKINKNQGRDHWGPCQSVVMAGGGVRGGVVYGASDKEAAYPTSNPVSPEDFIATSYHALGLPPSTEILDQEHRPHRLSDGRVLTELFG